MNVSLPGLCVLIAACAASPALAESTINIECSIPAQNHTLLDDVPVNTPAQTQHFQVSQANGWSVQEWEFISSAAKISSQNSDITSTIRISRTTGDMNAQHEVFYKDGKFMGSFTVLGKCRLVSSKDKLF